MSLHLLDLRPIKDITSAEKANLPVSIALQPDGKPFVVSCHADEVWDFYPYIPQENLSPCSKQIDWRILLPDGCLLTDPAHAALLESSKDFIWSLFAQPVEGRKRPTMSTLRKKVKDIIPLLRWMVKLGLHRFANLAGRTLDYVPVARINKDGGKASATSVLMRLFVVEDIYRQRCKLNDGLPSHPWPHETAISLAGKKYAVRFRKPTTEVISDTVAGRLAEASLDYVQNHSARVLAALENADAAAEKMAALGCVSFTQMHARTNSARKAGFDGSNDLKTEGIRLRAACYIVIDLFSGIRDSEMMSLAEHCISTGRSMDGSTDVQWLHGTIYKTGLRTKKWLVPPVVREAIDVLTRLTAPLREKLRQEERNLDACIGMSIANEKSRLIKRLYTVRKHKDKLFLARSVNIAGCGIAVLSGKAMRQDLKNFCVDLGIRGEDGQPYPLHPHQFRRTYAKFMARAELGDLLTLRDHFGHWSIDMTVYYTDGGADDFESDTELLEMVTTEKLSRQNEIMGGYLNSDTPLANGTDWLKSWRSSVRTALNKEALIAEYAGTITLNGTGHSWCVGNAKGTGCGGLCVFEAQMCVDCNYGIIGQEHRPAWEGIRDQQKEALGLDDIGPGGRARARQILSYAEKVLRRLDGQEVAT